MLLSICHLKPKGNFHFGTKEGWLEGTELFAHSDTLFSAICHNLLLLYGKSYLEEFLNNSAGNNNSINISSLFPSINEKLYFPVPKNQFPEDSDYRKINFIEFSIMKRCLNGEDLEVIINSGNKDYLTREQERKYWSSSITPRVSISNYTGTVSAESGGYFQFGQVQYDKEIGLFFLYKANGSLNEDKFKAAIRLLADEGLGGDRSVGKGFFEEPSFGSVDFPDIDNSDAYAILSLYHPVNLPIKYEDVDRSYYDIILRKGYMFSPYSQNLPRNAVRMFSEGSIFPQENFDFGKLVDVTPDGFNLHRVFRNGKALALPCKLEVK
ncbi:MAG: type III-A CRISPR-associated RAMP protein Csm4 [Candidatus Zixiibacteriota bacterium]|nr:MAG: type III-A CRISPR-associated RAMP protein Csm4 [candidate division Zixibacteria bacterium]